MNTLNKKLEKILWDDGLTNTEGKKVILSKINQVILKEIEKEIGKMEKNIFDHRTYTQAIRKVLGK